MSQEASRAAQCSTGGFLSLFAGSDKPLLGLSPMAGATTAPYRGLCSELGASFTVTELVSVRSIIYDPAFKRTERYLARDPREKFCAIQLFGSAPQDFARAITILLEHPVYSQCDWIDLNFGCPVPKVVKTGAGAALLLDLDRACAIAAVAAKTAARYSCPVTIKTRLGFAAGERQAFALLPRLASTGIAAVFLHARTRAQMYGGRAERAAFAGLAALTELPFFANGDIADPEDIAEIEAQANVAGFLVGRAALGNPFVFAQLRGEAEPVTAERWLDVVTAHLDGLIAVLGESLACREMRSQLAYYLKGFRFAAKYRNRLYEVKTRADVIALLAEAAQQF